MAHCGTGRERARGLLTVGLSALLLAACKSEPTCVWGVGPLLAEAGVTNFEGKHCGYFNANVEAVSGGLECLKSTPKGQAAQFTVNYCLDCKIPLTYVITAAGEFYHVVMEADRYGDPYREARVEACDDLIDERYAGIRCANAAIVYSCWEPL